MVGLVAYSPMDYFGGMIYLVKDHMFDLFKVQILLGQRHA